MIIDEKNFSIKKRHFCFNYFLLKTKKKKFCEEKKEFIRMKNN